MRAASPVLSGRDTTGDAFAGRLSGPARAAGLRRYDCRVGPAMPSRVRPVAADRGTVISFRGILEHGADRLSSVGESTGETLVRTVPNGASLV